MYMQTMLQTAGHVGSGTCRAASARNSRCRRILHVGPLPPAVGGMAVSVENYLQSNVTAAFAVVPLRSDLVNKLAYGGWRRALLNGINGVALAAVLAWHLVSQRIELVHICTNSYGGFFEKSALALLARAGRTKVLLHVHGGAFRDFYQGSSRLGRYIIRRCLAISHRVIAISAEIQESLLATGLSRDRVVVIENAVFLPPRTIWDSHPGEGSRRDPQKPQVTMLFLNRIEPAKGVYELAEAATALCRRRADLQIRFVGPDSQASRTLCDRFREAGVADHVQFSGPVTGDRKREAFLDADLYVLPSHLEGMPIGLLEAMSYGLPCVTTPVGAVPGIITDRFNGLLVPAGDVDALRTAIEQLLDDPSLRRSLGMRARQTVEARFNWESRAAQIIDLYEEVIEN